MRKALKTFVVASLCLSSLGLMPSLAPVANAAACTPVVGTVSGTTRYAIFNSGVACTWVVPVGVSNITYLAVGAGGGGGGARPNGANPSLGAGGGGAGGLVAASSFATTAGSSITLTVGVGGGGGAVGTAGGNGGSTTFTYSTTTITAAGGNGGAGSNGTNDQNNLSGDGGSNGSYAGGQNVWDGGGGGAGSGGIGGNGSDIGGQGGNGGNGGSATLTSILGSNEYYGGGGGGGGTPSTNSNETDGSYGTGGNSVGGNGGGLAGILPTAGATNTGSGGGGGGWRSTYADNLRAGAAGANGRVIFTFTKSDAAINSMAFSSSAGADNYYAGNENISITLTASEAITVTGSPRIAVVGLTSKYFTYYSGTGTSAIVFRYTVATGDSATAGVGIAANTLALNGGTMVDSAGLSLPLTHLAIAQSTSHRVDGIVPTLVGVTQSFSMNENETRTITLTTSESATFAFTGGDMAFFVLSSSAGTLTLTPRDFENKQDADANNVYYVGIRLIDLAGNSSGGYNFNITILNVAEFAKAGTPTLSVAPSKGSVSTITVTSDVAGRADFYWNGKRIPGCINIATTGSAPNITAQCAWKPSSFSLATIYARIRPTNPAFSAANSASITVLPVRRSNLR